MYEEKGYLELDELKERLPSEERLKKGPVAIIECIQEIPCNPCQSACNRKAIKEFERIVDIPSIDFEKCNGCGICIAQCPGLAIFVVWKDYNDTCALIKIPYEFIPLPELGREYDVLNRRGETIGRGKVIKIQSLKANPKTKIIWITIPKDICMEVRNIKVVNEDE